jgi:hypothetical protein
MTDPYFQGAFDNAGDQPDEETAPHNDEQANESAEPQHDDDDKGKKSAGRKAARPTAKLTAAQVRRVLAQSAVIESQPASVRDLLAAALGTSTSTDDLVVATLSAPKAPVEAIVALTDLAPLEPYDKFVPATAIAVDKDSARRVWGLLTALGKVSGSIPAKDVVAGSKIAAASGALTEDDLTGLRVVTELLGA